MLVAPQLLGGVFAWGSLALSIAALAILAATLWAVRGRRDRMLVPEPMLLLSLAVLSVTILHALPLPLRLASMIAPDTVDHVTAAASGLGHSQPQWIPFSLDPGSTHERILFAVAVLASLAASRILGASSRNTTLLHAVALSGLLVAASHLGHRLLNCDRVFGVYAPGPGQMLGPILNPNNLAGFMALTIPVCVGLAAKAEQRAKRYSWFGGAAVIGAVALLARSRGGSVVVFGGVLLFGLAYLLRQRANVGTVSNSTHLVQRPLHRRFVETTLTLSLLLGIAALLAGLASNDFVDTDYRNLTKLAMYQEELRLLVQNSRRMLIGVGRGAFSASFAVFQQGSIRAQHAESLPLQYAIEFGIPLAALFLGGAAARIWTPLWQWRTPVHLGAVVGVIAIALQNLVDFSLELSGIALPAAVCLGSGIAPAIQRGSEGSGRLGLRPVATLCFVVCVGGLALGAPTAMEDDLPMVRAELQGHFTTRDRSAFWNTFERGVKSHPADAEMIGTAGAEMVLEQDRRAAFWLNRAMLLAPGWEVPRLWAAQWLFSQGKLEQGLAELSVAASLDPELAARVLCHYLPMAPRAETVLSAAPQGNKRQKLLHYGARCLPPAESARIDSEILAQEPDHIEAGIRRAERSLAAGQWDDAQAYAIKLRALAPKHLEPYNIQATAMMSEGRPIDAVKVLTIAVDRADDHAEALTLLARAQATAKDELGMRKTIEALRSEAAGDAQKLGRALSLLSDQELNLGNVQRALAARREAYRLTSHSGHLAVAARIAVQAGLLDYALSAWRELCNRDPSQTAEFCREADELQRKMTTL